MRGWNCLIAMLSAAALLAHRRGAPGPARTAAALARIWSCQPHPCDRGVLDGFGHVSVRDPRNPDRFLLARSMAPALVTAGDILEYDRSGEPLTAGGRNSYLERFIHAAIYRARKDVKAIVHCHSPSLISFGVTGTSLRPVYHMSAFLGTSTPILKSATRRQTDMLVSDNKLGDALASALGDHPVVLLRGHGAAMVGNSIQQAVFRAIYAETNAKLQAEALRLGKVTYLSAEEEAKAGARNDAQLARPWELWKARVGKIQ
jgi:HCOMODA/2-hydroxy-3-carboxy-muconic semialdehyde decarboxylase